MTHSLPCMEKHTDSLFSLCPRAYCSPLFWLSALEPSLWLHYKSRSVLKIIVYTPVPKKLCLPLTWRWGMEDTGSVTFQKIRWSFLCLPFGLRDSSLFIINNIALNPPVLKLWTPKFYQDEINSSPLPPPFLWASKTLVPTCHSIASSLWLSGVSEKISKMQMNQCLPPPWKTVTCQGLQRLNLKTFVFLFTWKISIQKGTDFLSTFLYMDCSRFLLPCSAPSSLPHWIPSIPSVILSIFMSHIFCCLPPTHSLKVAPPTHVSFIVSRPILVFTTT